MNARVAGIQDANFIHHRAVDDALVRAFDEAVIVDARKAGERRNQTDVRTFRRFDRADAAVVSRMDVAHFEAGAFAGETAWSKGRETPFVRDLGERIGLIHELRELARSEEFADRGHDGLRVHQVVRHGRRHFLVNRHLFLDRALHADEADAELVFEKFADRADAAVAEVIDVVDRADALAQFQQVADGVVEIFRMQNARIVVRAIGLLADRRLGRIVNLDRKLHAADARKIVLARIEEHAVEQLGGGVHGGRIARAQLAVDFDQRFFAGLDRVLPERRGDDRADFVALREEHFEGLDAGFDQLADDGRGQFLIGIDHHFAGRHIDHVGGDERAFEIVGGNFDLRDLVLDDFPHQAGGDLAALRNDGFAGLVVDGVGQLQADEILVDIPEQLCCL